MIRFETRKNIWAIGRCGWTWKPNWSHGTDVTQLWWLCFYVDRLSKEWIEFCEEHGGGLTSTWEWLEEQLEDSSNSSCG